MGPDAADDTTAGAAGKPSAVDCARCSVPKPIRTCACLLSGPVRWCAKRVAHPLLWGIEVLMENSSSRKLRMALVAIAAYALFCIFLLHRSSRSSVLSITQPIVNFMMQHNSLTLPSSCTEQHPCHVLVDVASFIGGEVFRCHVSAQRSLLSRRACARALCTHRGHVRASPRR